MFLKIEVIIATVHGLTAAAASRVTYRHRLNGYLAQRVPSVLLASSFRMCLNCEVLECIFAWD